MTSDLTPEDLAGLERLVENDSTYQLSLRKKVGRLLAMIKDQAETIDLLSEQKPGRARLVVKLEEARATVDRVGLLADNGNEAHYDNPGPPERPCIDLRDLRAALAGDTPGDSVSEQQRVIRELSQERRDLNGGQR